MNNILPPTAILFMVLLIVWSMFWKGWALWRAARNQQPYWFGCLFLLNTASILDILYIAVFSKKTSKAAISSSGSSIDSVSAKKT